MSSPYTLIRSRRRTLELRVLPDQRVEVRAPMRTRQRDIDAFVESRRDWLARTLERMQNRPPPLRAGYHDGARHPLLGNPLTLSVAPGTKSVTLDGPVLHIQLPEISVDAVARSVENWFRNRAREIFETEIDHRFAYFARRGHARPTLRIKRMKSRWGSLSARGYINLNLALVYYPRVCLEYVVVHELCHLEHMDHGPGFKALMSELMPDWHARRMLLNQLPQVVTGV